MKTVIPGLFVCLLVATSAGAQVPHAPICPPMPEIAASIPAIERMAHDGDAFAQVGIGLMCVIAGRYEEGAPWLRKAADQGELRAMITLAELYDRGLGVAKDHSEAAKLNRQAADQGIGAAQYSLATMYFEGRGVDKDAAEGLRWMKMAAEQDCAIQPGQRDSDPSCGRAQLRLAVESVLGRYVPQDYAQAYIWADLAVVYSSPKEQQTAAEMREKAEAMLSATQLEDAKRQSREWKPALPPKVLPGLTLRH
jgi:TPR repeat protein